MTAGRHFLRLVESALRAAPQTLEEIAARSSLSMQDVERALDVLIRDGLASHSHPRGRGLRREPTFKRGPSGLAILAAARSAA